MELTSGAEKLAQDWKLKIKEWNLNASLPEGLEVADGRKVSGYDEWAFKDHGPRTFDSLMTPRFNFSVQRVESEDPDANLLASFPTPEGDVVWYRFYNFKPITEKDKRSGFRQANLYMVFQTGEGAKFVADVKSEPTLADAIVAAKFPEVVAKVEIKAWKRLVYIPQDVSSSDVLQKMEVVASR